jgi:hypothetical protein
VGADGARTASPQNREEEVEMDEHAMLYVVVDELIPGSHLRRNEQIASVLVLVGFGLMMFLDNVFGYVFTTGYGLRAPGPARRR